ncbi:MAG: hypothetical protein Ct9H300mP20_19060 [Gammaproteobacteria bacterium]|nr:MAG: hypothetical protein Ct9H300mP20_19060 [Gammaproteobacteria bacterium]
MIQELKKNIMFFLCRLGYDEMSPLGTATSRTAEMDKWTLRVAMTSKRNKGRFFLE